MSPLRRAGAWVYSYFELAFFGSITIQTRYLCTPPLTIMGHRGYEGKRYRYRSHHPEANVIATLRGCCILLGSRKSSCGIEMYLAIIIMLPHTPS